jgi:hypothetical protein
MESPNSRAKPIAKSIQLKTLDKHEQV